MILWHVSTLCLHNTSCVKLGSKEKHVAVDEKHELALKWHCCCCCCSQLPHQTEWRSKRVGSWMKDGLFSGWKWGNYTRGALCTHRPHSCSCIFLWTVTTSFVLFISSCNLEAFSDVAHTAFPAFQPNSAENFCNCPWPSSFILACCTFSSSSLLFFFDLHVPSPVLLFLVFSLPFCAYIHPYIVGFATFIENH